MAIIPMDEEQTKVFNAMSEWATVVGNHEWHAANDPQLPLEETNPLYDPANWDTNLGEILAFAERTGGAAMVEQFKLGADDDRRYAGIDHENDEQNCALCPGTPIEDLQEAINIFKKYP